MSQSLRAVLARSFRHDDDWHNAKLSAVCERIGLLKTAIDDLMTDAEPRFDPKKVQEVLACAVLLIWGDMLLPTAWSL